MKNENDDIEFILKVLDFNEIIDDLAQLLKESEEERKYAELNRRIRNYSYKRRNAPAAKEQSTRALIEKFSIWEK